MGNAPSEFPFPTKPAGPTAGEGNNDASESTDRENSSQADQQPRTDQDQVMAVRLDTPSEDGRDSSPPTLEPNFRELDDSFLQTQARIWLGEVLHRRFDEAMDVSDLLADGLILYELCLVLQNMLDDGNATEVLDQKSVSSNDVTEKYPYPKVESFIRICQTLGLGNVDLFTSSDVVHKKNTRKVCMCLRSLSKKARLKELNVPDFDIITYTGNSPISMPTDMVEKRQRSMERSLSPIDSFGQDTSGGSRRGGRQEGDSGVSGSEISASQSHDCGDDMNSVVVESCGIPTSFSGEEASSQVISRSLLTSGVNFVEAKPGQNNQGQEKHDYAQTEDTSLVSPAKSLGPNHSDQENSQQPDSTALELGATDISIQMDNDQSSHDTECVRSLSYATIDFSQEVCSYHVDSVERNSKEISPESNGSSSHFLGAGSQVLDLSCKNDSCTSADSRNQGKDVSSCAVNAELSEATGLCTVTVETNEDSDHHHNCINYLDSGNDLKGDNTDAKEDVPCEKEEVPLPSSPQEGTAHQDSCNGSNHQSILQKHSSQNTEDGGYQIDSNFRDIPCSQDIVEDRDPQISIVGEAKPVNDDIVKEPSDSQKRKMSLVVKGVGTAAVIGLVLVLFQLRKNGRGRMENKRRSEANKIQEDIAVNSLSNKVRETTQANHVYPSDRLRFN